MRFALALIFLSGSAAIAQAPSPPVVISEHAQKVLSGGDGRSEATAYKVKSVREEYEILTALGLKPGAQSLVVKKKPYDLFDATDVRTGESRQVWFDISSFYPEF